MWRRQGARGRKRKEQSYFFFFLFFFAAQQQCSNKGYTGSQLDHIQRTDCSQHFSAELLLLYSDAAHISQSSFSFLFGFLLSWHFRLQRNEKWRKKMSREKKNKIKITSSLLLLLLVLYYHHIATCVFRFFFLLPGRTVCKLLRKIVRLTVCYIWYPFARLLCALARNIRRPIPVIITLHMYTACMYHFGSRARPFCQHQVSLLLLLHHILYTHHHLHPSHQFCVYNNINRHQH